MLNQPPAPGIPGMSDTLEFVKNLWGSMNVPGVSIPGMAAPALTTEELDKKIADLKAVEAWLNLNGTMLRGTIQTLEVQRGTIAALQSMGASFAQAMKPSGAGDKSGAAAAPFGPFFAQAGAAGQAAGAQQPGEPGQPAAAAMPAAVAWWNLLEEQFRQAVTSAMSPESMAGAAAMAKDAASRFGAAVPAAPAGPAAEGNAAKPAPTAEDSDKAAKARAGKPKTGQS
jgi:hypothetical protein